MVKNPMDEANVVRRLNAAIQLFNDYEFHLPEGSAQNEDLTQRTLVALVLMGNAGKLAAKPEEELLTIACTISRRLMIRSWRHEEVVKRHNGNLLAKEMVHPGFAG